MTIGALSQRFLKKNKTLSLQTYALLIVICVAFFFPGFVAMPPLDRDEPSFAQASKQMIEDNNYVDIKFQNVGRYKKPIGIYWLQAASVRLLNPDRLNEIWAYRIPSMIGAIIAVLMTAALGTMLFDSKIGVVAALMMAGCVMLNSEARLAKTDATLLATIMVAQYALARAYLEKSKGWWIPLVFWTAVSAGFLVKGPIILLVVCSTLLWLWRTEKTLSWFRSLKPWVGLPYCLLLITPWFLAISLASHGQFIQQSAGHDMLAKIWQGQDRGVLPPGLHLLVFPVMFFPFSLLAVLAAPDAWENRPDKAVRFCLGWIIPTWIVFEISLTKLPHYVLPCYPAIAMLAAKSLSEGFPSLTRKNYSWLVALTVGIWLTIGTGFAVATVVLKFLVDHKWDIAQIAAGGVLVASQSYGLFLLFQKKKTAFVVTTMVGAFVFIAVTVGHTLPGLQHFWLSNDIVNMAQSVKQCEKIDIVTASYDEPSLVFLAGTHTAFYLNGAHAAAALQHDPCRVAVVDDTRLNTFLDGDPYLEAPLKPVGSILNYNVGHGSWRKLWFYVVPGAPQVKLP